MENVLLKFAALRVASNTVRTAVCIDVLCRLATPCSAVVASPNSFTRVWVVQGRSRKCVENTVHMGSFWFLCEAEKHTYTNHDARGAIVSSKMSSVTRGHAYTYTLSTCWAMWCMHILYGREMRTNECYMCMAQCETGWMRNGSVSMFRSIVWMHVCARHRHFPLMQVWSFLVLGLTQRERNALLFKLSCLCE